MATNNNGLEIPVSTPGAEKAAGDLDRVATSLGKVGGAATETGAMVASGSNSSAESLKKIGDAAKASEQHLKDLKATGNAGLQELSQKGAEFAKSLGGVGGDLAEIAVKAAAAFGPMGIAAGAAVGVVGMLVSALNEHQAAQELDRARSEALAESTTRLGGSYTSVAAAINSAKTATEARSAAGAAELVILQQQVALMQRGFSGDQADAQAAAISRLVDAQRLDTDAKKASARALIEHALASGNAEEQQRILGVSFRHSTDAVVENRNQVLATTVASARAAAATVEQRTRLNEAAVARRREAQAAVDGLSDEAAASAAGDRAMRELRSAQEAAIVTYRNLNSATASNARLQRDAAAAAAELRSASVILTDAQKEEETTLNRLTRAKNARASASGGPSDAERRAAVEALRVAREENSNSLVTVDYTTRVSQAQAHLAFTTTELARAEAALRRGRPTMAEQAAVTQALNDQTAAQAALNDVDREAAAALQTKNAALAEQARLLAEAANGDPKSGADDLAAKAQADSDAAKAATETEKSQQGRSLSNHIEYTARVRALMGEQKDAQQQLAEFSVGAFGAVGEALGNNIAAFAAGKATIGDALQGMLSDILNSLGKQAMAKGAFEVAEGIAALAGVATAGLAPGHFAAAAAYFTVGGLATAGGAATAVTPSTSAAAGGGTPAASVSSPSSASGSGGPATITNINYYAPTFGGREGTEAEVGVRLDRYNQQSETRLRRQTP